MKEAAAESKVTRHCLALRHCLTGENPVNFIVSFLQRHQLACVCKGLWTDVAKLLVSFQGSGKKEAGQHTSIKSCRYLVRRSFFSPPPLPTLSMCNCVSVCDSQTVHRCAVEGIIRHLLDAIAGEPSVGRKRSQSSKHQAVTASVNPFSFHCKEAIFHFFVLLAQSSEPFTLQRFDLKGSRRRVKPQLCSCVCFCWSTISPARGKLLFVETHLC